MAGLPSGGDDGQYSVGDFGIIGAAISGMHARTQSNIENILKEQVQNSQGWGDASNKMFAGLFPDGETPFPVLFLLAILEQLLGFVPGGQTVIDLLVEAGEFFSARWQDLQNVVEWVLEAVDKVVEDIYELSGIHLGSWGEFVDSLNDGEGIDLPAIFQVITNLQAFFGSINLQSAVFNPIAAASQFVSAIVQPFINMISGWLKPIFRLPVGQIVGDDPELLLAGAFPDADSIAESSQWDWDSGVSHSTDGSGSAHTTGNGRVRALRSNEFEVSENDRPLLIDVWVKWSDVVASGESFRLDLVTYSGPPEARVQAGIITLDSISSPASSGGWTKLSDEWTVPAGVTAVRKRLVVTGNVTAGDIWFDDASTRLQNKLQMSWVDKLVERWERLAGILGIEDSDLDGDIDMVDVWNWLWDNVWKGLNWIPTVAQNVIDGIHNGFANLGEWLDELLPHNIVGDVIRDLLRIGVNNSTSLAAVEAEIRLLKSEGNTIRATFEGAAGSLPSGSWEKVLSTGGGSGDVKQDGKGNAVWDKSGGSSRGHFYRHLTSGSPSQLSTDACVLSGVLASDPPSTGSDPAAYTYLCFSMSNSSEDSWGQLRIGRTRVAIEAYVNGVYTELVESVTINPRAGQTFQVFRGESGGTNLHNYVVTQNGIPVPWNITGNPTVFTDSSATIKHGVGFRGAGFGMRAGSRTVVPILVFSQWLPAALGVLTCAEVL